MQLLLYSNNYFIALFLRWQIQVPLRMHLAVDPWEQHLLRALSQWKRCAVARFDNGPSKGNHEGIDNVNSMVYIYIYIPPPYPLKF